MSAPILTLTTDFGSRSPFVAAMKGVILSINPEVHLVDLSHDIPPYDVRHAAFFLADALPYFPPNTLHTVVVDPGVGGTREILFVAVAGQRLLVPDNGLWTLLADQHAQSLRVIRIREPRFWRSTISPTFHGRDIFAPVAAHLSLGANPAELGPVTADWQQLQWPAVHRRPDGLTGEVIFVDHFGNLITNIAGATIQGISTPRISLGETLVPRCVRAYSDGKPGDLVALVSSNGLVEIAEVHGDAARRLHAGVGSPVSIEWKK